MKATKILLAGLALAGCMLAAVDADAADRILIVRPYSAPSAPDESDPLERWARALMRDLASRSAIEISLVQVPIVRQTEAVLQQPDTCAALVPKSTSDRSSLDWIGPVLTARILLLARDGVEDKFEALSELHGRRVGVQIGGTPAAMLEQAGVAAEPVGRDAQNLDKLSLGRIDFWLDWEINAKLLLSSHGRRLLRIAFRGPGVDVGLACNPALDPHLRSKLADAVRDFYAARAWEKIGTIGMR